MKSRVLNIAGTSNNVIQRVEAERHSSLCPQKQDCVAALTLTKQTLGNCFLFLVALSVVLCPARAAQNEVLNIGSRLEPFMDEYLIDTLDGAKLRVCEPRDEGVVLRFDKAWEGPFCGYATVIHDGGIYRLYYRGLPVAAANGSENETTCYAESEDGINWRKPELGLCEGQGTKKTNIILANAAPTSHNFSPFLDKNPQASPETRYKALGGTSESGLIAYVSANGIVWRKLQDGPVFQDGGWVFDSQNVSFWSEAEGQYVLYYRKVPAKIRAIARATSKDFIRWSEPVMMTYSDTNSDVPAHHLYTNQTRPYFRAKHIYVSTAARFMPGRQVLTEAEASAIKVHPDYFKDTADVVLMTSRGGNRYDRACMSALIKPGIGAHNWVSRTNLSGAGGGCRPDPPKCRYTPIKTMPSLRRTSEGIRFGWMVLLR